MDSSTQPPDNSSLSGPRRFRAGGPPKNATRLSLIAFVIVVLVIAGSWCTLFDARSALGSLKVGGFLVDALCVVLGVAALFIVLPCLSAFRQVAQARRALAGNDLIAARVAVSEARNCSWIALGYAAAQTILLFAILFLIANDLAVSRTFFLLPLIGSSFFLILKAFWINVYIFVIAEILVLIWGLVVAIASLTPGKAGKPVRMIATFYIDVFRSLPAIITIYLVGFGIPLTGLAIFKDLSQQSFVILALTLSSGAYVAEIYRAGIESIHWSQTAAARSLGLSYMQTLRFVIVPQAIRQMIPPLLNSFIALQKDTALVNVIGAVDAFNQAMMVASNHYNLSAVTTVAILFILITIPQTRLVERLVKRDQRLRRANSN
jgi:polar amino acid transport system permease protein